MESKNKELRSGYTTGACAAAAAKAAALLLLGSKSGVRSREKILNVEIPFPDGSRVPFKVHSTELRTNKSELISTASVIKDAGDDPDVTHGAEIRAEASFVSNYGLPIADINTQTEIIIRGGAGVGRITKPGLAVPVGEPAINPVPRKMIRDAALEALSEFEVNHRQSENGRRPAFITASASAGRTRQLEITISVPAGEELAKKTLNRRLGIIGGISILGTTGIVRPVSTEAYTASITASMDVARAAGLDVVVLSSGRTSEKAHMKKFHYPEEAYVMMGDYLEFAFQEAKSHGFKKIHLCAQWAKMIKTAMGTPQTHVRHGALEAGKAVDFLSKLGLAIPRERSFNTTREIFEHLQAAIGKPPAPGADDCLSESGVQTAMEKVCNAAKQYTEGLLPGIHVTVHLVSYEGEILAAGE